MFVKTFSRALYASLTVLVLACWGMELLRLASMAA